METQLIRGIQVSRIGLHNSCMGASGEELYHDHPRQPCSSPERCWQWGWQCTWSAVQAGGELGIPRAQQFNYLWVVCLTRLCGRLAGRALCRALLHIEHESILLVVIATESIGNVSVGPVQVVLVLVLVTAAGDAVRVRADDRHNRSEVPSADRRVLGRERRIVDDSGNGQTVVRSWWHVTHGHR